MFSSIATSAWYFVCVLAMPAVLSTDSKQKREAPTAFRASDGRTKRRQTHRHSFKIAKDDTSTLKSVKRICERLYTVDPALFEDAKAAAIFLSPPSAPLQHASGCTGSAISEICCNELLKFLCGVGSQTVSQTACV